MTESGGKKKKQKKKHTVVKISIICYICVGGKKETVKGGGREFVLFGNLSRWLVRSSQEVQIMIGASACQQKEESVCEHLTLPFMKLHAERSMNSDCDK